MAALAVRPADIVLAEPLFIGAAFLLAHQRSSRPAVVTCGVVPLTIDSRDTAPFGMGLPPARLLNRQRNAALAAVNRRVQRRANEIINDQHRQVHGKDMPFTLVDWGRRADALVQFSLPSFEYPRTDAPANLHFVGPLSSHQFGRPRYRSGGPILTEPGPSSMSLRARSPTPTMSKPSRQRCARLPGTTFWSWSQRAVAHWTRCPRCRPTPALRRTCRTTNCFLAQRLW